MLAPFHTILEICIRTAVIYVAVLIGMRISGKREVGQMTPFDLVLLLLIANAVQNAMTGPDTTLVGGLAAAGTLIAVNTLVSRAAWKSKKIGRILEGSPTPLIHYGQVLEDNLSREKITLEELDQALREHGVSDHHQVSLAMLEIDGSISVLRKDEMPPVPKPHHRIRFLRRKS